MSRLRTAVLLCSLSLPAIAEGQQHTRAGAGSVAVGVSARLVVGIRIDARQAGPADVATAADGSSVVTIPVSAAANVDWQLSVVLGIGARHGVIEALDPTGRWALLPLEADAPLLVHEGDRTNPVALTVRLRVSDRRDLPLVERARLRMEPKESGAP